MAGNTLSTNKIFYAMMLNLPIFPLARLLNIYEGLCLPNLQTNPCYLSLNMQNLIIWLKYISVTQIFFSKIIFLKFAKRWAQATFDSYFRKTMADEISKACQD